MADESEPGLNGAAKRWQTAFRWGVILLVAGNLVFVFWSLGLFGEGTESEPRMGGDGTGRVDGAGRPIPTNASVEAGRH